MANIYYKFCIECKFIHPIVKFRDLGLVVNSGGNIRKHRDELCKKCRLARFKSVANKKM